VSAKAAAAVDAGSPAPSAPGDASAATRPAPPRFVRRVADKTQTILRLTGLSAWRGFLEFYNGDDLTYAASIAYYSLLSLFPFLLLLLSVLGTATADENDRTLVLTFVLRYFPTQFEFVTRQLDAFRAEPLRIGIAGGLTLIWAALGVFGAVSTAVNHAWGVEKQRSYLKHKVFSFLMLLSAGGILCLALLLVSAIQVVEASWFARVVNRHQNLLVLQSLTVRNSATFLLILVVGLIFYFVPNAKVRFRDVWVGAVLTGILWRLALAGFSWYVRDMHRYTVIHGSIGAVVVFLFWVYVSAVILLYGVEFTAAYGRLRRHRPPEIPAAPSPRT
jgi:membrane protein